MYLYFKIFIVATAIGLGIGAAVPRIELDSRSTSSRTYKNVVYYADWSIYDAKRPYHPNMMPAQDITHLIYSFGNVKPDGMIVVDQDIALGTPWSSGCIEELMVLKQKHRGLKTLLSIGGWTYSQNLQAPSQTPKGRENFAASAVDMIKNLGFDGIDIDWEYPGTAEEASGFLFLLRKLRTELDAYAKKVAPGYHFQITITCPYGPHDYTKMPIKEMDRVVDSWHLMAYDYVGSWEKNTGHGSNLNNNTHNPKTTPYAASKAVDVYLREGIPIGKIVLGMPLYGRTFSETSGLGTPHAGGSKQILYRDLPLAGSKEYYDTDAAATFSYDSKTREWVTYQGKQETKVKGQYIMKHGLGGAMWWQASGDKEGNESLIFTMGESLGTLDASPNLLQYPDSPYSYVKDAANGQGEKNSLLEKAGQVFGLW